MSRDDLIKKLQKIKELTVECLDNLGEASEVSETSSRRKQAYKEKPTGSNYLMDIVSKIKDCEESEKIDSQILDKRSQEGRILLPFYICYKYFPNQRLTTGDIEKITSELGAKIKVNNVSKAIKKGLWKYLDGDSPKKKGKTILYKLNRRGFKRFEIFINAQKDK